jgi:hypothetical protein
LSEVKAQQGINSPAKAEAEVVPFPDLLWAWNGFWRLSNSRPVGFNGVLRIPLSEIEAYARLSGFDYGKSQDFLSFVERMDHRYMEYVEEQREIEEAKQKNKSREKGRTRRSR